MLSILEVALFNAVLVIPLALVALTSARLFRRPPLTHLLWVLVLVKLLTPPVWQVPLIDCDWWHSSSRQVLSHILRQIEHPETGIDLQRLSERGSFGGSQTSGPQTLATRDAQSASRPPAVTSSIVRWLRDEESRQLMMTGFLITWSLGALGWFAVQGYRCLRFSLLLRKGYPADSEFQRFSDRLARRLGLASSPTVWLMPGVMSPMLWGTGDSLLLIFPERMLDRLDEAATGTLLTHELAHCRRRDHWVRVIALLATGFFWWHPVVWWARREIEASEEECCDALVVARSPVVPKCYAEAILEVIDFLAQTPARLPALATGLSQVPFLRQRLTWIMRGPRQQDFGNCGRVLCLVLLCLLPLQPSWLATGSASVSRPGSAGAKLPAPAVSPAPRKPKSSPPKSVDPPAAIAITSTGADLSSRWTGFEVKSHSADGRFVVLGNQESMFLFDFETGHEFDLGDFLIQSMSFARTSAEFVSVGRDNVLRIWNAELCEVIQAWHVPYGSCKSVDVSADGELIATGGRDGIVRLWNRANPRPVEELPRELAPVNCVRFSVDQRLLAVATGEAAMAQTGRIALFETENWIERISMNWNSPPSAVVFSDDGDSLISGDSQGRVARWSISTGEIKGFSEGHHELMAAAEFSASGSPLAQIVIPDLPADQDWSKKETSDSDRWFFRGWMMAPMVVPAIGTDSTSPL